MPVSKTYQIISPDSAITSEFVEGGEYSNIKSTDDKKVWMVDVMNLPKNQAIKINVIGTDSATIASGSTVRLVSPTQKRKKE